MRILLWREINFITEAIFRVIFKSSMLMSEFFTESYKWLHENVATDMFQAIEEIFSSNELNTQKALKNYAVKHYPDTLDYDVNKIVSGLWFKLYRIEINFGLAMDLITEEEFKELDRCLCCI